MTTADTIAAIATATGGGIGVVRVSGPHAEAIVAQVVRPWPSKRVPSHQLRLGWACDPKTGERIDQVMACVMRAPRSYTGEDVAELQGHGGARLMQQLLEAVLAAGARLAEPGEFTRRAFEHGRIDLTRAEGVAALVAARSSKALAAAQALAGGALEREIAAIRSALVRALAEIDGALDFPEDATDAAPESKSAEAFAELAARCRSLADGYRRIDHDRVEVALVGRANAGKSSLFNALAGSERALVDEAPGTTRDVLEVDVEIAGIAVRLLDTAGERWDGQAAGRVEQRGLVLAGKRTAAADALVLVVDGTVGLGEGERERLASLGTVPKVVAWNKRDLAGPSPEWLSCVETSATTGAGLDALRDAIARALGEDGEERAVPVGARHREALVQAAVGLDAAARLLGRGEPAEVAAVEARRALDGLGRVTGETVDLEVLDAIFSRFCIGK
jgi:tRNA modification GTPase